MHKNNRRTALVAFGLSAITLLSGCAMPSTATDEVALQVGSGFTEGKPVKDCIPVGTREVKYGDAWGDEFYYYPANQRTYDFTGKEGADENPIEVVSSDNQKVLVPGQINFTLAIDCDTLTEFHNKLGRRYEAYMRGNSEFVVIDETTGRTGWQRMLSLTIGRAADVTMDRVAKEYTWRELFSDPSIKDEMQTAVEQTIEELVNEQLESDFEFFEGYSALIGQPVLPGALQEILDKQQADVAAAQSAQAKAVADAEAKEAAAKAQVAQKEAELTIAQLDAQSRAAEIAAFGGPENYINYQAIQKGQNPFQPTYGSTIIDQP